MGYARNKECTNEVRQLIKDGRKKFVRLDEGAILYSVGIKNSKVSPTFSYLYPKLNTLLGE